MNRMFRCEVVAAAVGGSFARRCTGMEALCCVALEAILMTSSFPGIDPMRYATAQAQWIEPFAYQEHVRGKQVRTELAWALSALYRLPAHQTHVLCTAVERMNVASLIHDDLLDGDCLRRGVPAVWKRYGAPVALVSGMYGYLAGLRSLTELNDLGVLRAGLKCLESLHIGQYLDTQISEGAVLPSLEEYGFVAQANTGCFFVFQKSGTV